MNEKPDEPRVIEKRTDADGRLVAMVVELPYDVRGWLQRNAGYAPAPARRYQRQLI